MGIYCFLDKSADIIVSISSRSIPRLCWRRRTKLEFFTVFCTLILSEILMFPSSVFAFVGAKYICDKIPELTPRQRDICYANPNAVVAVDEGSHLGLEECYRQFRHHRWNCQQRQEATVFGLEQKLGTKEAAFHSAIRAAGVLHAIATACGEGHLRDCGCDTSRRGYFRGSDTIRWNKESSYHRSSSPSQAWKWGGCSVDIKHGIKYSREIWDAREISRNLRSLMNLHNYEAGRRVVVKRLKVQCKCHGVSASCTTNTCWVTLPDFREVGNALKRAYLKSRKVFEILDGKTRPRYSKLLYLKKGVPVKPLKRELVYLEKSPSYCEYNSTSSSEGTVGRICRNTSVGNDNCSDLCCKRGYKTQEKVRRWECKCKFYWCCHVQCKQCWEITKQYICL